VHHLAAIVITIGKQNVNRRHRNVQAAKIALRRGFNIHQPDVRPDRAAAVQDPGADRRILAKTENEAELASATAALQAASASQHETVRC